VSELRELWDAQAAEWGRFVRTPGHDFGNDALNLPKLIELLPPPGRRTLDLGCGEGRVGRALIALGHRVVGPCASIRTRASSGGARRPSGGSGFPSSSTSGR
jgi:SAM-dependent methyltransferase